MRDRPLPVSKCAQPPFRIRTVAMMAPHCGQERVRLRVLSKELIPHGIQQALTNISLPDASRRVCCFRLNQLLGIQITPCISTSLMF